MTIPDIHRAQADRLPPGLRALLEAELAAGNAIAEEWRGHPVPPAGAGFMLARPVDAERRKSAAGVRFYDRNHSSYAGEFSDDDRFFFLVEPPRPPEPPPDMDAIRAALQEAEHRENCRRDRDEFTPSSIRRREALTGTEHLQNPGRQEFPPHLPAGPPTAWDRFMASMQIDFEKWHDGTSYDLTALDAMSPEEREAAELMIVDQGLDDWRDVEALAHLNTPLGRQAMRDALDDGCELTIRNAILSHAPDLVSERERIASLVEGLETGVTYGGLTQTLLMVEEFHPPEVVDALFRGALNREGGVACHLAGMLKFVHGQAPCAFDWDQRPFFLRFLTEDKAERETVFRELCGQLGVPPEPYLKPPGKGRGRKSAPAGSGARKPAVKRTPRKPRSGDEPTGEPPPTKEAKADEEWAPPAMALPAYDVKADITGGKLIYLELQRYAEIPTTFTNGQPTIPMSAVKEWRFPGEDRREPMTDLDKAIVMGRLAEVCMGRLGMTGLQFGV